MTPSASTAGTEPEIDPRSERYAYLAARLRAMGQRATPQRLLILAAFESPNEHLTADEVYSRIAHMSPVVNRSTVYRTLEMFRDSGVISETDLGGGVRQYELLEQDRHHHLICRFCGHMFEIDDAVIEPIRAFASEQYGFQAEIDHLALFGRCSHCAGDR